MISKRLFLSVILMLVLFMTKAQGAHFTGNLRYGDGLSGANAWSSAKLSWTVDDETNPGLWTYRYSFSVDAKAISAVIIGAAKSFISKDIRTGTTHGFELGTFGQQGASTPGIPGDMYGMKWDVPGDALEFSWKIVTDRAPMWGDFYAKNGKDNREGKQKGHPHWVFTYSSGFGSDHFDLPVKDGKSGGWALVPGMTSDEKKVLLFALDAFKKIRDVIDPEDRTGLKATILDTHIEVSSAHWTYVLDRAGHQIFRPLALLPHLKATLSKDIRNLTRWLEQPVPEELVMQAKQILQSTFGGDAFVGATIKAMPTRELITSKKADSETVRFHEGRMMVLFSREKPDASMVRSYRSSMGYTVDGHPVMKVESADTPSRSYEAAITFAPGGGKLIRAESSIQSLEVRDAARILNEGLAKGTILGRATPYDFSLRFGSFHDPDEKRFELNAYSYEGEKFLQPSECSADECDNHEDEKCRDCNPFYPCFPDPDVWWCNDAMFPTTGEYRNTPEYRDHYRYWSWYWWFIFEQKNGIRGNWNKSTQSWEKAVTVSPPKNLESYGFEGWGGPFHEGRTCNNDTFSYQAATGKKLKAPFYQDLESNHIALINTHGGPIDGVYQLRRGVDVWFKLHEEGDNGLGKGRLRYLFLETCSGMNWNNNVFWQPQNLFTDWMNWHVADGLRMALGYDGTRMGHFWNGWLFFGHYHGGDSISQAWFNQALLTHSCNVPVVVAYGDTEDETLATLLDGRFKRSRGGKGWIIASEVLPHSLLNDPRPCCMPGGACVAKTRFDCLESGGRPHDCGKSCGDEDVTCPNP